MLAQACRRVRRSDPLPVCASACSLITCADRHMSVADESGWAALLEEGELEEQPGSGWDEVIAGDASLASDAGHDGWVVVLCESPHDDLSADGWGSVVEAAEEEQASDAGALSDQDLPEEASRHQVGGELVLQYREQHEFSLAIVTEVPIEVRRPSANHIQQGADDFLLGRCLLQVGVLPETAEYRRELLFDRTLLARAHTHTSCRQTRTSGPSKWSRPAVGWVPERSLPLGFVSALCRCASAGTSPCKRPTGYRRMCSLREDGASHCRFASGTTRRPCA